MSFAKQESSSIDFQRLAEVCMEDTDAMLELGEFFFSQADQVFTDLPKALAQGESEEVRKIAHRLLGASFGCGMVRIADSLSKLEQMGKDNNLSSARELFPELTAIFEQTRAEFLNWAASHKSSA